MKKIISCSKKVAFWSLPFLVFNIAPAFAANAPTLGAIATTVVTSFEGLAKLITAGAFLAGVGFAMASIFKFKAHKDNPQQIPIGTPIALLFVAGALMFLPTVYGSIGTTVFGTGATKGSLTGTTEF